MAWDLGHRGSPSDQAFLAGFLCAGYGADDSGGLYVASPPGGGDTLFAGSGTVSFDDGSHGVYDVDYPDVLVPQGAAVPCLLYGGDPAKVAGLQSVDPSGSRVVYLGFPLEAVWDETVRNWMMAKVLAFFFA